MRFSIGAPPLISKCATLIDEVREMLKQHLFPETNSYMSTNSHELAVRLDQFLKCEKWQEKLNQWAELGVNFLSDETENPLKNRVNILIKRDSAELPIVLEVSLCSMMKNSSFKLDLKEFEQDQERIRKYNLTYYRDLFSAEKDSEHLAQMLPKSNDTTRLRLLTEFNLKWKGQLEASYAINHQSKTGNLKITDASGKVKINTKENHVYLDPQSSASAPHPRRIELPQSATQDAAPPRNGTDRYDLRITGQKRSYKN
jgi:hypothetical protein